MSKVKEAIEEMIEESYLLGLSEHEIRQDFKRFIDTCYTVIHENIRDQDVVSGLAENLAREQTCILIADRVEGGGDEEVAAGTDQGHSPGEEFSERVARRKRQILRTIAQHDPRLVRLIDAQRFKGDLGDTGQPLLPRPVWRPRWRLNWRPDLELLRVQLLKVGYVATIAVIILLIWLGFAQKP